MTPPNISHYLTSLAALLVFFVIGLLGSSLIAWVAYQRQSLNRSGVLGTIIVGTTIFACGGSAWWRLLIAFFVSSSGLSHFRRGQKASLMEKFSKGGQRDIWQVMANGGLGLVLAVANILMPWPWLWVAFAGSLASMNADTWATELGVLSRSRPRLITTGQPVEPGTNGAMSLVGTGAALAGAIFIGVLASAFTLGTAGLSATALLFLATSVGGFSGALFDSLLGATVQGIYVCDHCHQETEQQIHHCGHTTRHLRGWPGLNNDGVNFLSGVFGMGVAVGIWAVLT